MWECMETSDDVDLITKKTASVLSVNKEEDLSDLQKDVSAFLNSMTNSKAVIPDSDTENSNTSVRHHASIDFAEFAAHNTATRNFFIGGFNVSVSLDSSHEAVLRLLCKEMFSGFETDSFGHDPVIEITLITEKTPSSAIDEDAFTYLFTGEGMSVFDSDEYTMIKYHDGFFSKIKNVVTQKNADSIYVFANDVSSSDNDIFIFCMEFFYALRFPFLLKAAGYGRFMLHSSSVLMRDKVYCFSAPSGVGKSTHTEKLVRLYNALPVNGDLNLIGYDDTQNKFFVYGTPWCGTSGVADKNTYPLGGIFLLKRGTVPKTESLSHVDSTLAVSNRMITPVLDGNALRTRMDFVSKLCADPDTRVNVLYATLDDESAAVSAGQILGDH